MEDAWCSHSHSTLHSGATVSNLESGVSDGDGQPPPSNNSRPQPSASLGSEDLVLPKQAEDGQENIPPEYKDGGVPVEGVGSPVEESGKERGQPPPGDLQRGSEHGMHTNKLSTCTRCCMYSMLVHSPCVHWDCLTGPLVADV